MKGGYERIEHPQDQESRQKFVQFQQFRQPYAAEQQNSSVPPLLHVDNRAKKSAWERIIDLDEFFTRVYEYHKRGGFWCMVIEDIFELLRFTFVAIFLGFLFTCVDYQILFRDKKLVKPGQQNQTEKVALSDAINFDPSKLTFSVVLCGVIAFLFWLYWLTVLLWKISRHIDLRNFYYQLLKIDDSSLQNLKWVEILSKLREAQTNYQFCVHKTTLNEMEVYHQILRRKNYLVALINKNVLPVRLTLPLVGEICYFTNGFKLNFEFLFFLSWYSPWRDYWRLKEEYKNPDCIDDVARRMEKAVFWLFLLNLLLSPVIFLWQIFYSLFSYGELIKREPGLLGVRRWSIYGKYFLRHFNELDHELEYRLNMAYKPSCQYLNMFRGNMLEILANNVIFFLGACVIVIIALSLYDQDVLLVQNVLTTLTLGSVAIAVCKSFLANENQVFCPELMLKILTAHLHYVPEHWKNRAHTSDVRHEFSQLFQYTATFVVEELFSPVFTPFILLFWLKPRCREILEFFRRFTIEVPSLGDVCSFAMLDVRKHGDKTWQPSPEHNGDIGKSAEEIATAVANLGKTELSLVHFQLTNPTWNPPRSSHRFLTSIREQCQHDIDQASSLASSEEEALVNPLIESLASLPMPFYTGLQLHDGQNGHGREHSQGLVLSFVRRHQQQINSPVLNLDQRHCTSDQLLMSSLMMNSSATNGGNNLIIGLNNEVEAEMSVTAAYLRELHNRKLRPAVRDYGSMQFNRTETSIINRQRYLEEDLQKQCPASPSDTKTDSRARQDDDFLWNVPGTSSSPHHALMPLVDLASPSRDEKSRSVDLADNEEQDEEEDKYSGLPTVHYAP